MLPPLASVDDLAARLPEPIADDEMTRAEGALQDASNLVRGEAGVTWVTDDELDDDIPDGIITVVLKVARRDFLNPEGNRQETLGDHSVTNDSGSYLTADDRRAIANAMGTDEAGIPGLSSVRVVAPAGTSPSGRLDRVFLQQFDGDDDE